MEWEYKIIDTRSLGDKETEISALINAGKGEWELVSVVTVDITHRRFFFKRPHAPGWSGPK